MLHYPAHITYIRQTLCNAERAWFSIPGTEMDFTPVSTGRNAYLIFIDSWRWSLRYTY